MRVIINDFGGYPFPMELSRRLAETGYDIMHCYLSNINTPHGNMLKEPSDVDTLTIAPILLKQEFKKYSPVGRYKGEVEYATEVFKKIEEFKPDIFLSANTPLIAQTKLLNKCLKKEIKFIYWCQDIHSIALQSFFYNKLGFIGSIFSSFFKRKEITLLKKSDHIITIAESFNNIFMSWGISPQKMTIIHNWGPFSEIKRLRKDNEWAKNHGVGSNVTIVYSGTLGLKHNPMLIVDIAKKMLNNVNADILVVSEGLGADVLIKQKELFNLTNLKIIPFQKYQRLSEILSTADILLAILEKDAGMYSVPSKVLTYLCSGKAIMLAVPLDNLSAQIIIGNNAGFCSEPDDTVGFYNNLLKMIQDASLRAILGANGRKFAEQNFPIELISENFSKVFKSLLPRKRLNSF